MSNLEKFKEAAMKELEELVQKGRADVNTAQAVAIYTKAIKGIDSVMYGNSNENGYSRGYEQTSRDGYRSNYGSNYGGSNEMWGNSRDDGAFKHRLKALLEEMDRN